MVKTAAERAKAYRQKKRDDERAVRDACRDELGLEIVTERDERDVIVTDPKRDAPGATACEMACVPGVRADLPADVQASIEKMCSENNNGERAASHTKAIMTERALAYQWSAGNRIVKPTGQCQACGGPVQHPAVVKCLKCCTGTPAPKSNPMDDVVRQLAPDSGPLSVYSPDRWAFLQEQKHVWCESLRCSRRPVGSGWVYGVTVPGDPAYNGVANV